MYYSVQPGDSLSRIALQQLGEASRWPEIARLNGLRNPHQILIGQVLRLPADGLASNGRNATALVSHIKPTSGPPVSARQQYTHPEDAPSRVIPARAFLFVLADEVNPFTKKVVRKVAFPKGLQNNPVLLNRILHPEKFGFSPRDPLSKVSIGRHVLGRTDSRFISASQRLMGSPRFPGNRYWIDVNKFKASGGVIHDGLEIANDLDRIAAKTKNPKFLSYIEDIRQKSLGIDREVLLNGEVPGTAVKGAKAMAMTRGLQFVQGVGIVVSAYELGSAGAESYRQESVRPIAAETVRQVGGWGAAWAGLKIGAAGGALLGIETGPGAVVTAAAGGLVGGVAGYFGADWIADQIYENEE